MSMLIPESKVNLQERDVEDYIYAHPEMVDVESWLKRQYHLPSGIVDLFGTEHYGEFVVVEVKNIAIDNVALAQVCRYAHDLEYILARMAPDLIGDYTPMPEVKKIVVGRSIDDKTFREAEALNVRVITFDVQLTLVSRTVGWTVGFKQERQKQYSILSTDPDLISALQRYDESLRGALSEPRQDVLLRGYKAAETAAAFLAKERAKNKDEAVNDA